MKHQVAGDIGIATRKTRTIVAGQRRSCMGWMIMTTRSSVVAMTKILTVMKPLKKVMRTDSQGSLLEAQKYVHSLWKFRM